MGYFDVNDHISASFLKSIIGKKSYGDKEKAFRIGTLAHAVLFEPDKITEQEKGTPEYYSVCQYGETFMNDPLCINIFKHPEILFEHEHYHKRNGFKVKSKSDGEIKSKSLILEYKTLSVKDETDFLTSVEHFDYDLSAAWYILVTGLDNVLIAAVSKSVKNKLFKLIIQKGDKWHQRGEMKYLAAIRKGLEGGKINERFIYDEHLINHFL